MRIQDIQKPRETKSIVTTVRLTPTQYDFIKKNNISLADFLNIALDDFIKKNKEVRK